MGMGKLMGVEQLFEGRHFDREVIILCVRWYLRFKLSLRDLVEMMARQRQQRQRGSMLWPRFLSAAFTVAAISSANEESASSGATTRLDTMMSRGLMRPPNSHSCRSNVDVAGADAGAPHNAPVSG
jgi:hypothetical protein